MVRHHRIARRLCAGQLPRLNRILALKDLGFSLDQVAQLLTEELPAEQLRGMLRMRQMEIQQHMRVEQERLARVQARLRQIEKEDKMPAYEVLIKTVEPQTVAAVRGIVPSYGEQGPLWKNLAAYLMEHKARATAPSLTIYYDTEYREQDVDLETATPTFPSLPNSGRVSIRELPGVESMACTVHHGQYETIGEAYTAVMNWIEANGYHIIGPNREVYLRCPDNEYEDAEAIGYSEYVASDPADFVTEIQFPVAR